MTGAIHSHFSLSYAAYLVLPRLSLQEMPHAWQDRFVALLDELEAAGVMPATDAKWSITRRGRRGRIVNDPWRDYRHGTITNARQQDVQIDGEDE